MNAPTQIFNKVLGLLLLPLLLGSCEKDITSEVDLDTIPKLVVMSFISPLDTVLEVYVRKSLPVVGVTNPETASRVANATVEISDGTNRISLPYNEQYKRYMRKPEGFAVVAGKTYHLSVSTPEGMGATGSCTIPSTEGIRVTDITTTEETMNHQHDNAPEKRTNMRFTWQDAPGQPNYYRTYAFRTDLPPNRNDLHNRQPFNFQNMLQPYISDEGKDGQLLTSASSFAYDNWGGPQGDTYPRPYFLHTILTVTDEAYYRYHRTMNEQIDTQGNPFAEPVILYNNLQGALGVFCGYNQVRAYKRVE